MVPYEYNSAFTKMAGVDSENFSIGDLSLFLNYVDIKVSRLVFKLIESILLVLIINSVFLFISEV